MKVLGARETHSQIAEALWHCRGKHRKVAFMKKRTRVIKIIWSYFNAMGDTKVHVYHCSIVNLNTEWSTKNGRWRQERRLGRMRRAGYNR